MNFKIAQDNETQNSGNLFTNYFKAVTHNILKLYLEIIGSTDQPSYFNTHRSQSFPN